MRSRVPSRAVPLVIAAAFALFFFSNADAVIVGLGAGAVVFAFGFALPRHMPKLVGLLVAVGVMTAPMVPGLFPDPLKPGQNLSWLSPSAAHRILIWQNTVDYIKQKPLLGGGFDTARALYGVEDRVKYQFPKEIIGRPYETRYEPIPLHPHNAVLQVRLELGGVGVLILLGLLLAVVHAISRQVKNRFDQSAALGMYTTALVLSSLSFGAWQSWWLTSILLGAAFLISMVQPALGGASEPPPEEIGGPKGPEPTRYGDWERKGRAVDF